MSRGRARCVERVPAVRPRRRGLPTARLPTRAGVAAQAGRAVVDPSGVASTHSSASPSAIKGMFRRKSIVNAGLYLRIAARHGPGRRLLGIRAGPSGSTALRAIGANPPMRQPNERECAMESAVAPCLERTRSVVLLHPGLCANLPFRRRSHGRRLRLVHVTSRCFCSRELARTAARPRTGSQAAGSSAVGPGPTVRAALSAAGRALLVGSLWPVRNFLKVGTTCYGCRLRIISPRATTCCGATRLH